MRNFGVTRIKFDTRLILIVLILFSRCTDYSDHKIIVDDPIIDDIRNPYILVGVTGNEGLNYKLKLEYKGRLLGVTNLYASFEEQTSIININFSNLNDNAVLVANDILEDGQFDVKAIAINSEEKVKLDTSLSISVNIPPLSTIKKINGIGFSTSSNSELTELIRKAGEDTDRFIKFGPYRVGLLSYLLKNKTFGIHATNNNSLDNSYIYKKDQEFNVELILDTAYRKTIIARYPSVSNKFYSDIDLDSVVSTLISRRLDSIPTMWEKDKSEFIVKNNVSSIYSGQTGLYLINIDEVGNYSFVEFGAFISDNSSPVFSDISAYDFGSNIEDERIEGKVKLKTEDFYGYSPFTIPFVGEVRGDIKTIIVDGKSIPFKRNSELFFKKKVYLDNGYNRIPVKVIDLRDNITESYIEVTIERSKRNEINIDIDDN